jgi:hypothetical protein
VRGRRRVVVTGMVLGLALAYGPTATASADTISATCSWAGQSQACNPAVWYPSALTVVWQANPPPDNTSGCLLGIAYHYNTDSASTVTCSATWLGPPKVVVTNQYAIHVEVSNPRIIRLAPARSPDSNAWYNHPVTAAITASSFSGIASCTPSTYSGPDATSAAVIGSCTDNAGKTVLARSAPFAYDATSPPLSVLGDSGDHFAVLGWSMTDIAPSAGFEIVRRPGLGRKKSSVVYRGPATAFRDRRVRNGVRYQYTVIAHDVAGNSTSRIMTIRPGPRLLSPANGTQLAAPPLLLWTPVRRASYYNVQLWRGRKELLSTWPTRVSMQLTSTWSFQRHRYRLRPGTYRWYVWPGFGRRAAARYGRMIGWRTFIVTRS